MIDGDSNSSMDKASTVENPTGTSGEVHLRIPSGITALCTIWTCVYSLKEQ